MKYLNFESRGDYIPAARHKKTEDTPVFDNTECGKRINAEEQDNAHD